MTSLNEKTMLYSDEFLTKIPKTNLHVHLDGAVRLETLIELSAEQNLELPTSDIKELKSQVFKPCYQNLEEYLQCFAYTTAIMRNAKALDRIAYEFAVDQYNVGVRYFEVRFAPQLNAVPGELSIEQVLVAVNSGLSRATDEFNTNVAAIVAGEEPPFAYGIIVCAMRFFLPVFSPYYQSFWECHKHEDPHRIYGLASMALVTAAYDVSVEKGIPIVALDIAGAEEGYPASDHIDAFTFAHKKFLHKTVHAGEGYGPESIYQAVTDLHAERIGHGFHVFSVDEAKSGTLLLPNSSLKERQEYVENLARYLGNMRICLEVCLSSNLQTIPALKWDIKMHPFKRMLENKLAVSLCTDNCTVSHTDIVKEYRLAVDNFDLSPQQLKDLVITGFKRSFMSCKYVEKRNYNRKIISYYEKLEREKKEKRARRKMEELKKSLSDAKSCLESKNNQRSGSYKDALLKSKKKSVPVDKKREVRESIKKLKEEKLELQKTCDKALQILHECDAAVEKVEWYLSDLENERTINRLLIHDLCTKMVKPKKKKGLFRFFTR